MSIGQNYSTNNKLRGFYSVKVQKSGDFHLLNFFHIVVHTQKKTITIHLPVINLWTLTKFHIFPFSKIANSVSIMKIISSLLINQQFYWGGGERIFLVLSLNGIFRIIF